MLEGLESQSGGVQRIDDRALLGCSPPGQMRRPESHSRDEGCCRNLWLTCSATQHRYVILAPAGPRRNKGTAGHNYITDTYLLSRTGTALPTHSIASRSSRERFPPPSPTEDESPAGNDFNTYSSTFEPSEFDVLRLSCPVMDLAGSSGISSSCNQCTKFS